MNKNYDSPQLEVCEVLVEEGFAASLEDITYDEEW